MQAQSSNGLQFLFEKSKGVDTYYLYNAGNTTITLQEVRIETNVFIGRAPGRNLTTETRGWMHQAADFEPSTDDKIKYLRFLIQGQVSIGQVTVPIGMTVSQLYEEFFCSWNQGMIRPGIQMTREEKPTHFVFRLTYAKDNLLEIGPYEQVSLSCANSFYGLPIRSPVAGVQYLPKMSVTRVLRPQEVAGETQASRNNLNRDEDLALQALVLVKDDTERRTLDRTMAGKARSKDLTRRLVGYYANYFMFERNYFVTDIPLDQVNCISYGMMALQGDGSLISSDEWADNYQIAALQFIKELNPSLQISLIVGGWPKCPPVHFYLLEDPTQLPGASTRQGIFQIFHVQNSDQWALFYNQNPALLIDHAPFAYFFSGSDPTGLFDQDAPKRGLYRWLHEHGERYLGREIEPGESADVDDEILELVGLLSKAFAAQKDVAPFAAQFRRIAKDPLLRARLAESANTAVTTLGFDGFEVDWEYPGAADAAAFVELARDLRKALGSKSLSIAAAASAGKVNAFDIEQWRAIGAVVDHVNIMSYDYCGTWSSTSWFNTPMKAPATSTPGIDPTFCLESTVNTYLHLVAENCLTRRQLNLGLAGYGQLVFVEGADDHNKGLLCPQVSDQNVIPLKAGADKAGAVLYRDIVAAREVGGYRPQELKQPQLGWSGMVFVPALEPTAKAPFAYRSASGTRYGLSLSYDDPRSLRQKVRYALEQQFGGVMIWDLSGDVEVHRADSLIAAIADELRQCHPATAMPLLEQEQDPWLSAARESHELVAPRVSSQVQDYGALAQTVCQPLGSGQILALGVLPSAAVLVCTSKVLSLLTARGEKEFEHRRSYGVACASARLLPLGNGWLVLHQDGQWVQVLSQRDGAFHLEHKLSEVTQVVPIGTRGVVLLHQGNVLQWWFDEAGWSEQERHCPSAIACLAPLPNGDVVLVSGNGEVLLWPVGCELQTLSGAAQQQRALWPLLDGRLLAWGKSGELILWQLQGAAGQLPRLEQSRLPWNIKDLDWLDCLVLSNGGFALLARNRLVLWRAVEAGRAFEVVQQLTLPDTQAMTLLADGSLLLAQGQSLQRLGFPCWPQVQEWRFTPWQAMDKDARTSLHWLARRGRSATLEQWLSDGAPADLSSGQGRTLLAEALQSRQTATAALLLSAGAPLCQPDDAAVHNRLLQEEVLAQLLPASLSAVLPAQNCLPVLKQGFTLDWLEASQRQFLLSYPLLTARMAIAVYLLLPSLADRIQNLLSVFVIDDECLELLQGQHPELATPVKALQGRTYANPQALDEALAACVASGQQVPVQWPQWLRDASRRTAPGLSGEARYDQALYDRGRQIFQAVLDLALEQPLGALQHKQLLDQLAALAAPQPGALLCVKGELSLADLPQDTKDFLTLYPRAGQLLVTQLKTWSPELVKLLEQYLESVGVAAAGSGRELDGDSSDVAHRAIRALLVATVQPPMSEAQATDFLSRQAPLPWSPPQDPLGMSLARANWSFDCAPGGPAGNDERLSDSYGGSGHALDLPGQVPGSLPLPGTDPAPSFGGTKDYIAQVRKAGASMVDKSKPGKDNFEVNKKRNFDRVESSHPLSSQINAAQDALLLSYRGFDAFQAQTQKQMAPLKYDPMSTDSINAAYKAAGGVGDVRYLDDGVKKGYIDTQVEEKEQLIKQKKSELDKENADLKRLKEQRALEVSCDPSVRKWEERQATLKKWNDSLDQSREVLEGIGSASRFTRMIGNLCMGDGDEKSTFNKVMDYIDITVSIAVVAVDTIKAVANAFQAFQGGSKLGGVMGIAGAVFNIAVSLFNMFNPQPDPYLEAAKAISKQLTQVYENLSKQLDRVMQQLQGLSQQVSILNHQMDARFDGLQRQLDEMSSQLGSSLEHLNNALVSGFRMSRAELRSATQQTLASIVWSHDDLANRMALSNRELRTDLAGLSALMNTQMLADLEEIDVILSNAGREQGKPSALLALRQDPARLQALRDRLDSGLRHKLLAGGIAQPLAELCFDSFDPAALMDSAQTQATEHFAECFAFYYSTQQSDSYDRSSKVWRSTVVALPLARHYVRMQSWYAPWLENPLSVMGPVLELVESPVAKSREFLLELPGNTDFFEHLLNQYLDRALSLHGACQRVAVREFGQSLRLPTERLTQTPYLLPLMFDRFARLALTELVSETVASDRPERRDDDLAAVQAFLNAPAGNWRLQKIGRTLALGHALGACDLYLAGDDSQRQLGMVFAGRSIGLVQLTLQNNRLISARLLEQDNALFAALGQLNQQVRQQWIATYNRRIPMDCVAELKALDTSVSWLALFLGLAGLSTEQLARVLGSCWDSQRVQGYLQRQGAGPGPAADQLSPPFGQLAFYTSDLVEQAKGLLKSVLREVTPTPVPELPSLRDRLLTELDALLLQARGLRDELAGTRISQAWLDLGVAAQDGCIRLSQEQLRSGMTLPVTPALPLSRRSRLTLSGSGRFNLTWSDQSGQLGVQAVDLDQAGIAQVELGSSEAQAKLVSLGFSLEGEGPQAWLEGVWLMAEEEPGAPLLS
nr:hypothetical protein FFPRI1PSEUD_43180 [Pseudomonas sp. FFPRI_1]